MTGQVDPSRVSQNYTPPPAANDSPTMDSRVDSMRDQLPGTPSGVPSLSNRSVTQFKGGEQRKGLLQELKTKEYEEADLPELHALRNTVLSKLQQSGGSVMQRIKTVFANIAGKRQEQLEEARDLIDAHISKLSLSKESSLNADKDISTLISHLNNNKTLLKDEGVFRLTGSVTLVNEWTNKPNVDPVKLGDVHNITGVMKKKVRDDFAKDSKLNEEMHAGLQGCFDPNPDIGQRNAIALREKIYAAKPYCRELFQLLHDTSKLAETNKMTPRALGIVMGPNLFGGVDNVMQANTFVAWMIRHPS